MVELLPLEPLELLVAVVNDVKLETIDGAFNCRRAAASTARKSSAFSSSSSEESEELWPRPDLVRRRLCRSALDGLSREDGGAVRLDELLDLSLVEDLPLTLLPAAVPWDLFCLSLSF